MPRNFVVIDEDDPERKDILVIRERSDNPPRQLFFIFIDDKIKFPRPRGCPERSPK